MDFYTLDYITAHQSLDSGTRTAVILVALTLAVVFSVVYLRDRLRTRWRDVGIGLFVLSLALLGVQVEQYSLLSRQSSQSQRLVDFIEGVSLDQGVPSDTVLVSSTSLSDGMIVRLDSRDEDYLVHLNDDNNSYTLERTHIIDHHVYVNGER